MRSIYEFEVTATGTRTLAHLYTEHTTFCGKNIREGHFEDPDDKVRATSEDECQLCQIRCVVGEVMCPTTITMEDVINVAITALEGGIGYWSRMTSPFRHYQTEGRFTIEPNDSDTFDEPGTETWCEHIGLVTATEHSHDNDLDVREFEVTPHLILAGIGAYCRDRNLDPRALLEDLDADGADGIIQFAMFGEVVFG